MPHGWTSREGTACAARIASSSTSTTARRRCMPRTAVEPRLVRRRERGAPRWARTSGIVFLQVQHERVFGLQARRARAIRAETFLRLHVRPAGDEGAAHRRGDRGGLALASNALARATLAGVA